MSINDYIQKKIARRHGVKLNDMSRLARRSSIVIEETASLGDAYITTKNSGVYDLTVGAHSYIRSGALIHVGSIGRFCSIGQDVTIGQDPRDHPVDWASSSSLLCVDYSSSPPNTNIGNDVWVAHGAVVMAGVQVADGAIIGRNAVVTKDVEPYQIVVGNPAKAIKLRFDRDVCEALMACKWWDKDLDELKKLDCADVEAFIKGVGSISKPARYKVIRLEDRKVSIVS